jgi:tetratricopeptide (TPR) repeat protein
LTPTLIPHRFKSVVFLDGSSESRYRTGLVQYVRSLGLEHSQNSFEEALRALSSDQFNARRLVIIDNVDDPSMDMEQLLPQSHHGAIIITTRNHILGHLAPDGHIQLDSMPEDEAIEILIRTSLHPWPPLEQPLTEMQKVCSKLGFLPIALVHAGTYMAQTGASASLYLSKLEESRMPTVKFPVAGQRDTRRYKSAYAAFNVSYKSLPSSAQRVLPLLGVFHWSRFPVECIKVAAHRNFCQDMPQFGEETICTQDAIQFLTELFLPDGEWNDAYFSTIISSLRDYSFITISSDSATELINIHPIIQAWLSDLSSLSGNQELLQTASVRLLSCCSKGCYPLNRYLMSQVLHILSQGYALPINDNAVFAQLLQEGGEYQYSLSLWEKVHQDVKKTYGDKDERVASAGVWLAASYHRFCQYKETEQIMLEVLDLRKEILGPKHPRTIRSLANLAAFYSEVGRHQEAEQLQQEVWRLRKEALGDKHPDTLSSLYHLAVYQHNLGQYSKALKRAQQARGLMKELTLKHPRYDFCVTLITRINYHVSLDSPVSV